MSNPIPIPGARSCQLCPVHLPVEGANHLPQVCHETPGETRRFEGEAYDIGRYMLNLSDLIGELRYVHEQCTHNGHFDYRLCLVHVENGERVGY